MVYFGPQHFHIPSLNPSLKGLFTMLSLMTRGLAVKTELEGHRCFNYCLNLMLISHFKLFQSSSQRG